MRGPLASLSDERWKLVVDSERDAQALFDLYVDPGERDNRAQQEPKRVRVMADALRAAGVLFGQSGERELER